MGLLNSGKRLTEILTALQFHISTKLVGFSYLEMATQPTKAKNLIKKKLQRHKDALSLITKIINTLVCCQ